MSRLIFEARRRLPSPATRKGSINIEAPPELPRVIPPSLLRRALPVVIVLLIVGMIVAMVATGMRLISPQTLFFPFVLLLAATAFFRGSDNKSRTEEVDAEHRRVVPGHRLSDPGTQRSAHLVGISKDRDPGNLGQVDTGRHIADGALDIQQTA